MKVTHVFVAAAILLGQTAPAAAGKSMLPGGKTLAGPASVTLAVGAQERVFTYFPADSTLCVTVINSGGSQVTLTITGNLTPSVDIPSRGSEAVCVGDVQFVDLICSGTSSCTAQWRVDDN